MGKWILTLFVFLISATCIASPPTTPSKPGFDITSPDGQTIIDELVKSGIIVDLDSSEDALTKKLGQPLKREEVIVDNIYYDNLKDLRITYYYPGLEIIFYNHRHLKYGWNKIVRVEVSINDYHIKYGIRIGMHISEVVKKLGESHFPKWEANGLTYIGYRASDSVHDQILFAFKKDKLVKFIWSNEP